MSIPFRLDASTEVCELFAKGVLDDKAINEEKLGEDGRWSKAHCTIGFVVYAQNLSIRLPEPQIAGARVFMSTVLQLMHTQMLTVNMIQQLRGFRTLQGHKQYLGKSLWACRLLTKLR